MTASRLNVFSALAIGVMLTIACFRPMPVFAHAAQIKPEAVQDMPKASVTEATPTTPVAHASESQQTEHSEAGHTETGHDAKHEGGLPQLDITTYPGQLLWLGLIFFFLYRFIRDEAAPGFRKVECQRNDKISADLADADAAQKASESARTEYDATLHHAYNRAREGLNLVKSTLAEHGAAQEAIEAETTKRQWLEAESAILAAQNMAIAHLKDASKDIVRDAVQKIAPITPNDKLLHAAVDAAWQAHTARLNTRKDSGATQEAA